jgi:hypothetical protein
MSKNKTILLFTLYAILSVCSALTIPAFFWSGKEYLTSKYAHIGTQQQLLSIAKNQLSKRPKLFIAFLHKNLPSSEFLKFSGAFASEESNKNNAFTNLENLVKNTAKTSLVFPNCESHPSTTFGDSIREEKKQVHIISNENENAIKLDQFVKNLNDWKIENNEIYIVQFGDAQSKEQYIYYDEIMNKIVTQANKITNGDYVAMLSSDQPKSSRRSILSYEEAEEVQDYDVLFGNSNEVQSVNDINQASPTPAPTPAPSPYPPIPGYPNSTYANPSYITGPIFGATLVSFFLLALLGIILYGLLNIQSAPRMTDIDLDIKDVQKKNQ